MIKEFKEFIMRGSVLDLAIGIVIGAAFAAVVNSLVNDIIMPPIGYLLGGVNFNDLFISLDGQDYASLTVAQDAGAATINYGIFINTLIVFVVVAFILFLIIKAANNMKREEEVAPAEPTTKVCPYCFSEISLEATRCPNCTSQL
ncbi:MAG TPA: large conductance mechanosensitive channel protein MscL [Patescibacteria group bacterium]|nr:large conductance mechanosensitive channel protein MscL [Patescibacteria group bacterium]